MEKRVRAMRPMFKRMKQFLMFLIISTLRDIRCIDNLPKPKELLRSSWYKKLNENRSKLSR